MHDIIKGALNIGKIQEIL